MIEKILVGKQYLLCGRRCRAHARPNGTMVTVRWTDTGDLQQLVARHFRAYAERLYNFNPDWKLSRGKV